MERSALHPFLRGLRATEKAFIFPPGIDGVCFTRRPFDEDVRLASKRESLCGTPKHSQIPCPTDIPAPSPSRLSFSPRYGGAITAALYLDEFVGKKASPAAAPKAGGDEGGVEEGQKKFPWIHMDFMAFNQASRPGRPEGGEAQGMRALYALLEDMFGKE